MQVIFSGERYYMCFPLFSSTFLMFCIPIKLNRWYYTYILICIRCWACSDLYVSASGKSKFKRKVVFWHSVICVLWSDILSPYRVLTAYNYLLQVAWICFSTPVACAVFISQWNFCQNILIAFLPLWISLITWAKPDHQT